MKAFGPKTPTLAGIALTSLLGFAQTVPAYTPPGALTAGPGTIDFTVVSPLQCAGTLAISVTGAGAASVVGGSFAPPSSTACPFITVNAPWTFGPATPIGLGVYQWTVSGVSLSVRQAGGALIATCGGSLPFTLDQNFTPHRLSFSGTLVQTAPLPGSACPFRFRTVTWLPTNLTAP